MKTALLLLLKFIATVMAADFVAGFIHWLEDACLRGHGPGPAWLVAYRR